MRAALPGIKPVLKMYRPNGMIYRTDQDVIQFLLRLSEQSGKVVR